MTTTTKYSFEVPYTEIEVNIDAFINAVFDTLQSSFLLLPKGPGFVTYPEFQQAYEVLKRHTFGFTEVEPDNVVEGFDQTPDFIIPDEWNPGLSSRPKSQRTMVQLGTK